MRKNKLFAIIAVIVICAVATGVLAACTNDGVGIVGIEKTSSSGNVDTYTVTYTDGSTFTFEVTNGEDGANGANGTSVSATDIYEQYKLATGDNDLTYEEFVDKFVDVNVGEDNSQVISSVLRSAAAVYTEFYETQTSIGFGGIQAIDKAAVYTGSAVVYKIDGDYTWFITNYHVVYSQNANDDNLTYSLSGAKDKHIARRIILYLYGSEGSPASSGEQNGYTSYDYGSYAIECEYAGGSEQNDLALIKAKTQDVQAINPDVREVAFAESYDVGDTAIVIGNTGGDGISVTEGIVSVHSENINLQISSQTTTHRSMRVDAAMYGGNSGGGCFNVYGQLIGVPHAGNGEEEQGINYAIPVDTVKAVADNIYYYACDGNDSTGGLNALTLGVTVTEENSRYVYDETSGSGKITADTTVHEVTDGGIMQTLGLQAGDKITNITITRGGEKISFDIERSYMIAYATYAAKVGDSVTVTYTRGGTSSTTSAHTVQAGDIKSVG